MKKNLAICFAVLVCFSVQTFGQISGDDKQPISIYVDKQVLKQTFIRIVKAEDELRFDKTLIDILEKGNPFERERAALAAGRIGDEAAIPLLIKLLENDPAARVRKMAAFSLGELESIKGAEAIEKALKSVGLPDSIRARIIEAAGKIAAANEKDPQAKVLGETILDTLESEERRGKEQSREVILLGITAALRAKPEETNFVVAKFLTNLDARIRADAANTLSRLRAKNANEKFRAMLLTDDDAIARANAARGLGAAGDLEASDMLIEAAITDTDSRVRVNAIRSVGSLKDAKAADTLLERADKLFADYKKSKFANPVEQNELLEITTALGNILENTDNERAVKLLNELNKAEKFHSPELTIALARISPSGFNNSIQLAGDSVSTDWRVSSAMTQGFGELAKLEDTEKNKAIKEAAVSSLRKSLEKYTSQGSSKESKPEMVYAISDLLNSFAKFKTDDLDNFLRAFLNHEDVFVRTTAAQLLGEQKASARNIESLQIAFSKSLLTDRDYNDAQLAILSALVKLDKTRAIGQLTTALTHYDYLLRRHAADLIEENDIDKSFPKIPDAKEKVGNIKPFDAKNKSKLGQLLNTDVDYKRAVMRDNGNVKAVLTTEKGKITIELLPEDAPLTVDNFVKLAKSGYFNKVAIHRVVPNFVVQDGDPLGNGSGGPGWQIRDEMNTVPYERGAVGMALSGKNTGGSQWFVTHSPQPHLDGGYTVFGTVNETDMKIVDMLVRGDKILKVEIIEVKPGSKNKKRGRPEKSSSKGANQKD